MKKMHFKKTQLRFIVIFLFSYWNIGFSQNDSINSGYQTHLKLSFYNELGYKTIHVKLNSVDNSKNVSLEGNEILIFLKRSDSLVQYGKIITDINGSGYLKCSEANMLFSDSGFIEITGYYNGNDRLLACKSVLRFIPTSLILKFSISDTTKMIECKGVEINNNNSTTPISGIKINFYVPGLFGNLLIGSETMINGICSIPFPVTLPGNSKGELIIIAKIEENELYQNNSVKSIKNWGKVVNTVSEQHGKLWTTDPPIWMLILLLVIMTTVWSLYVFVFYKIFRIKQNKV